MSEFVVTQENFHKEVEKSKIPVLLVFWRHGCDECLRQRIILSRMASAHNGFVVGSVCCNEEPFLANQFRIDRGLPAIILMMRGSARCGKYHFMTEKEILKMVGKFLD